MAVHRACGVRDPLPYPTLENDDTFVGKRAMQKYPYNLSVGEAQSETPYGRLFTTHTLSSSRHQAFSFDPRAPNDDLDFLLKAQYDQHAETLKPLARTRVQKETISDDHGRMLKNRIKRVVTPPPALNHPLRVSVIGEKHRLEQAKLAIGSNHTIITNNGYSRKPNGSFYNA